MDDLYFLQLKINKLFVRASVESPLKFIYKESSKIIFK